MEYVAQNLIQLYTDDFESCCGSYGSIYKVPFQDVVVKVFDYPEFSSHYIDNVFSLKKKNVLRESHVILPNEKVFENEKTIGYSMPLVRGFTLEELYSRRSIPEIDYKDFLKAFLKAKEEIKRMQEAGIYLDDVRNANIMYNLDDKSISFIDIDRWKVKKKEKDIALDFDTMINLDCFKEKMENGLSEVLYIERKYYDEKELQEKLGRSIHTGNILVRDNLCITIKQESKDQYYVDKMEIHDPKGKNQNQILFIRSVAIDSNYNKKVEDKGALLNIKEKIKKYASFGITLTNTSSTDFPFFYNTKRNCYVFNGQIKTNGKVRMKKKEKVYAKHLLHKKGHK